MKTKLQLLLFLFFCPLLLADLQAQSEQQLSKWLERFPQADTNKDGKLTAEEAVAFRDKMKAQRQAGKPKRVEPTHADLRYGEHARNVIDLWIPEKPIADPMPIFIFFHGGGFVAGDKKGFDPSQWLNKGFAVASGNYRFVNGEDVLSPIPMHDAARAIQFLRTKANDFKLDTSKFALSGSSAGAVITAWIGYHDDLANPDSEDPIEKQSTRVACIIPINGPLNLDPVWIRKNMGGPAAIHGSFRKMFKPSTEAYASEAVVKRVKESSPWEFLTKDDPPTFLLYSTKYSEVPLPSSASSGELVHHPHFGKAMQDRLNKLGITNKFTHGSDPRGRTTMVDFVMQQFGLE